MRNCPTFEKNKKYQADSCAPVGLLAMAVHESGPWNFRKEAKATLPRDPDLVSAEGWGQAFLCGERSPHAILMHT